MGEITEALRRAERERESPTRATRRQLRSRELGRLEGEPAEADEVSESLAPVIQLRPAPQPRQGLPKPAAYVQVPRDRSGFWQPRLLALDHPGPLAEHYRHFAVRVGRELQRRETNSVLVTSASPGEGRTTTAFNLALAFATLSAGQRVALVDLDLRNPSIGRAVELRVTGGLEAVLEGTAPLVSVCARTDFPALDLLLAGLSRENAHELLVGERLPAILRELAAAYHIVVLDSPPVLPVPDAALIAAHAGACVPVVRAGRTRRACFEAAVALLPADRIAGVFLAEARSEHSTPSNA